MACLTAPSLIDIQRICKEVLKDLKLKEMIEKLILSKSSTLIPPILQTYHDSVFGGYSGFFRNYKRLTGKLYWEGMKAYVKKHVEECVVCQKNKTLALSPAGLLVPLGIPNVVWDDITMDFIERASKGRGKSDYIGGGG